MSRLEALEQIAGDMFTGNVNPLEWLDSHLEEMEAEEILKQDPGDLSQKWADANNFGVVE